MLIISEPSMVYGIDSGETVLFMTQIQYLLAIPASLSVRHHQDVPISSIPGPGSGFRDHGISLQTSVLSRVCDVGLAACLRVWILTLISLSVKLKIIIVIFSPDPSQPPLGPGIISP